MLHRLDHRELRCGRNKRIFRREVMFLRAARDARHCCYAARAEARVPALGQQADRRRQDGALRFFSPLNLRLPNSFWAGFFHACVVEGSDAHVTERPTSPTMCSGASRTRVPKAAFKKESGL